jgi:hypothetical protein
MAHKKRVGVATLWGLIFGVVSWLLCALSHGPLPWSGTVSIITLTGLMGFGIGISGWQISWWLHGLIMGLIYRIPASFFVIWVGQGALDVAWIIITGLVFGFLIELITSFAFKAKMSQGK